MGSDPFFADHSSRHLLITRASTPGAGIDHVIEMMGPPRPAALARRLMNPSGMRTIQISIGEIIEAVYEELMDTYGDREMALVAAQALGDDLLARFRSKGGSPPSDLA